MLNLPQVTLCCVDTRLPQMALDAMKICMAQVEFGDALFFTCPNHGLTDVPPGVRVIELVVSAPPGPGAQLVLRPRRAMTARQFTGLFLALSLAAFGVAGVAWSQGNVLAPAFAVLDAAFIAFVLRWVWRQGERF